MFNKIYIWECSICTAILWIIVIGLSISEAQGLNCFELNNGYSNIQIITERFEDTALTKIEREAKSNINIYNLKSNYVDVYGIRIFNGSNIKLNNNININDLYAGIIFEITTSMWIIFIF